MLSKISRWWRSKGHGIHSPFAYSMVTETLRCPEAYYIYDRIANIQVDDRERDLYRLLARLIIRFRPATVAVVGEWAGAHQIIRSVKPDVRIVAQDENPEMLIVAEADYLTSPVTPPVVAMIVDINGHANRSLWHHLLKDFSFGMTFTNDFTGIACLLSHLPRQHFSINF